MERHILAQITFGQWPPEADDIWHNAVDHAYHGLLGSLLNGGQIIGDANRGLVEASLLSPEAAWSLICDSLWNDPRADRQIEHRGWYLGTLIQRTDMPIARLTAILQSGDPLDTESPNQLAHEVLLWLAEKDYPGAAAALSQFPCDPDTSSDDLLNEPSPALHSLPGRVAQFDHLTLQEIIETSGHNYSWELGPAAAAKATLADCPWLLSLLSPNTLTRSAIVLRALAEFADPSMLPQLITFLEELVKQPDPWPACLRVNFHSLFIRLPAETTLPFARAWIEHDPTGSGPAPEVYRGLGESLMACHAQPEGLPLLLRLLTETMPGDGCYGRLPNLLIGLARVGSQGRQPLVERAYHQTQSATVRRHAAFAMAALCPEHFAQHFAAECAFDCDEKTRSLALLTQ